MQKIKSLLDKLELRRLQNHRYKQYLVICLLQDKLEQMKPKISDFDLESRVFIDIEMATGIRKEAIKTKSRKAETVRARTLTQYLLRIFGYSLKKIGMVTGKEHSTVLQTLNKLKEEPEYYGLDEHLTKMI